MFKAAGFVLVVLGATTTVAAQASVDSTTPLWNCPYERPAPKCATYLITEVEGAKAIAPGGLERGFVSLDLGYMVNRPGRTSLGASVVFQQGNYIAKTVGLRFRERWWITDRTAVDFGPGVFESAAGPALSTYGPRRMGYSAMAAISTHAGALTTTTIVLPSGYPHGKAARYQLIGFRGGGVGGAWLAALCVASVVAIVGLNELHTITLP